MKTSNNGLKFIARWEGFSPTAYLDANDGYTIGYGTLIDEANEQHLLTATITEAEALELKRKDVERFEATVRGAVTAPINQNQFDALVSFVYNVGPEAFKKSTLVKRINTNAPKEEITRQFMRWVNDDGQPVQGLINRREAEAELYHSPDLKKKSRPQPSRLSLQGPQFIYCPNCGKGLAIKKAE